VNRFGSEGEPHELGATVIPGQEHDRDRRRHDVLQSARRERHDRHQHQHDPEPERRDEQPGEEPHVRRQAPGFFEEHLAQRIHADQLRQEDERKGPAERRR
jgi:hypothetical protein